MKRQKKLEEGLNRLFSSYRKTKPTEQTESKEEPGTPKTHPEPKSNIIPMPEKSPLPLQARGIVEDNLDVSKVQAGLDEPKQTQVESGESPIEVEKPLGQLVLQTLAEEKTTPEGTEETAASEASSRGHTQMLIEADISPKSFASAARAFQLILQLQEMGSITHMEPSEEVIDTAKPVHHFTAHLATDKTIQDVHKALEFVAEIDKLTIKDLTSQTSKPDQVETTKPSAFPLFEAVKSEKKQEEFVDEQLVIFTLANQLYGINIASVDGINTIQPITVVPGAPDYIEGVINLRGNVVPVISLSKRLTLDVTEITPNSRIIIVNMPDFSAGMIVDSVNAVELIEGKNFSAPSNVISTETNGSFIKAIAKNGEDLIILLDLDEILQEQRSSLDMI